MARIKGNVIFLVKKYLQERCPPEVQDGIYAGMEPGAREVVSGVLVSSRFYELEFFDSLLESIRSELGHETVRKLGAYMAEQQLQGVFGLVARLMNRERLIGRMEKMWHTLYDSGRIELLENEPERGRIRVQGIAFTDTHLENTSAYLARLLQLVLRRACQCEHERVGPATTDFHLMLK